MPKLPEGGFILLHRAVDNSDIMDKPPHFRDIWFYLLRKAEWKNCQRKGVKLKRGQLLTSYRKIIDDLSWHVGVRPMQYKKHEIEMAFRFFTKTTMVTTTKTTAGLIVTILNYDKYQDFQVYETDSETDHETDTLSIIEQLIKNKYGGIDFPSGFPIEKFAAWELERKKNNKAPAMTDQNRKTALTHILKATKRPAAFRGIGYNSVTELLDQAAENRWRGFSWLNQKLNQWENTQDRIQQQRAGDSAPRLPTIGDIEKEQGHR